MSRFILLLLLLTSFSVVGQTTPEKLASGKMDKSKWQKTGLSLHKALSKDSLDPEIQYLLSLYFFTRSNPAFNIDSAYSYSKNARKTFLAISDKERDKLKKIPLDSLYLNRLTVDIDSAAFERAKKVNSEGSYQYFLNRYLTAPQRAYAIELRDEVAFLDALKINRWESFQNFMEKYPTSHRKQEAQGRYDKLLFEDKTKDKQLASFIKFHQQFPSSPFRGVTEKNIFELSTISGLPESFKWFIENYAASPFSKRAKNILYKLQVTEDVNIFDPAWMSDSLKKVEQLNQAYWVPVIKSGLFGFIDEAGNEVFPPRFENISEDYRCGEVRDRLLATSRGLIARNEAILWTGKILESKEIGLGFVLITVDSGKYLIQESGFRIFQNAIEDAQVVSNRFIAVKKNKKWTFYSFVGKMLTPNSFDGIVVFDSLIVLAKGGKKILTTPARIAKALEKPLKEDLVFDEVKRWGLLHYWVRNGPLEGVIDRNLNFIIPLDRQTLRITSFGFLRGKDEKLYIKGIPRLESEPYKSVIEQGGWVRMRNVAGRHLLYDKGFDRLDEGDSAWFQGQLAFLQTGDSVRAFLPSGQKLSFFGRSSFQFKEFRDSSAWLVLEDKKKKSVFDAASGVKLFTQEFDQIEAVSPNIFLITKGGKKGLVTEDGKILLPTEYDAIVAAEHNSFSLLKEKKFGWYDATSKLLIKPVYDRNIKVYNRLLRLAYKDKGYGFILPDGKPLGLNEWEDVQFWTDSVAWVKRNFQWILFDIRAQKAKLEKVRDFHAVSDTPAEKIYIVHQENAFGVISSRKGIIVPIQYSDILNLGSKEIPLYFTERHIEEAGISVVVYYDRHGKNIRRQAMETEEFERIYCDN